MTWNYESFWVVPKGWQAWHKEYPQIELRWKLRVVAVDKQWMIVEAAYSALSCTHLDQQYLDERFDSWKDAVGRAHDLVSTVATSHQGLTWPEAKAKVEATYDRTLL